MAELKRKIRKAFKNLVFRRVQSVYCEGQPITILRYETNELFKEITPQEYSLLSPDVKERECELKYKKFSGMVNSKPIVKRQETCQGCCSDSQYNYNISFHSENYCELDMTDENASFYFNPAIPILKNNSVPPRAPREVRQPIKQKEPTADVEDIEEGVRLIEKGKTACREARAILNKAKELRLKPTDEIENITKTFEKLYIKTENADELEERGNSLMQSAVECFRKGKGMFKLVWTTKEKTIPIMGDIICGVLHPRNTYRFQYWFVASEQFYKFFQMIMHDNLLEKQTVLSGNNKLCTNTYKKRTLAIEALKNAIQDEIEKNKTLVSWFHIMESDEKILKMQEQLEQLEMPVYWTLRGEKISKEFCHFYPALILVCCYNEYPDSTNVPGNHAQWIIPKWDCFNKE